MVSYVIKSGSVRIHRKSSGAGSIEVAFLGTGAHFGMMAIVDDGTRSVTATVSRSRISSEFHTTGWQAYSIESGTSARILPLTFPFSLRTTAHNHQ